MTNCLFIQSQPPLTERLRLGWGLGLMLPNRLEGTGTAKRRLLHQHVHQPFVALSPATFCVGSKNSPPDAPFLPRPTTEMIMGRGHFERGGPQGMVQRPWCSQAPYALCKGGCHWDVPPARCPPVLSAPLDLAAPHSAHRPLDKQCRQLPPKNPNQYVDPEVPTGTLTGPLPPPPLPGARSGILWPCATLPTSFVVESTLHTSRSENDCM